MKTTYLAVATATALTVLSTMAGAVDRWHAEHDERYERHERQEDYRDHRIHGPGRWEPREEFHHWRPRYEREWPHHVHDRWCNHWAPPALYVPRVLGPRPSRYAEGDVRDYNRESVTVIFRSDLN